MIDDFLGKLIADKYRIVSLVREGDSGDLYLGRHEFMDRPVTVKILPTALAVDARWGKRFLDEARRASAVSHENILNITDFGTDSRSVVYAVYDSIDGSSLRDVIASDKTLNETRAINIAKQTAAALAAAHAKNVINGRLNPRDIFINSGESDLDTVKVLGFGGDNLTVPRDAETRYLSPEQCTEFAVADQRSDVYSLGVILYEMLAGEPPFAGTTPAQILQKQNSEPPPPLSAFRHDLHPQIEPIILSAIARDPDLRYQTMADFAEDLERVSGNQSVAAAASIEVLKPRQNIWKTVFASLAGIAVLAAALIYATSVRQTDPILTAQIDANSMPVQPINPATGAQEDSLVKMIGDTDAGLVGNSNMAVPPGTLPGGDGYNAWANGGAPPIGAPPNGALPPQYFPPGGQTVTIDPNTGSPFMPNENGIILVPIPVNTNTAVKPTLPPKNPAANTNAQPTPITAATPKPLATPPPKTTKPSSDKPGKAKPPNSNTAPAVKPQEL